MQFNQVKVLTTMLLCVFLSETAAYAQSAVKRVAVLDFDTAAIRARVEMGWNVGKDVAIEIGSELARNGTFEIVERRHLDRVIRERGLSERFDKETAAQLGSLVGASAVVLGIINQFTIETKKKGLGPIGFKQSIASVELSARIVDVSTGLVTAIAKGSGTAEKRGEEIKGTIARQRVYSTSTGDLNSSITGRAMSQAVSELVAGLIASADSVQETVINVNGMVADVDDEAISIDVGSSNGLMKGDIVHIVHIDKEIRSPRTDKVLYEKTSLVAELILVEVGPDYAIGIVKENPRRRIKIGDQVRLPKSDPRNQ